MHEVADVTLDLEVELQLRRMTKLGIVRELTGYARNRVFAYSPYVDLLSEGTEPLG